MRITQDLPEQGTLAHRVCRYLQLKPGRSLSVLDIGICFHACAWQVRQSLAHVCEIGLLQRSGVGAESIYSAGPHLADTPLPALAEPAPDTTEATQ